MSIEGEIATYVKFRLILISFAWGFNLRFNSAAETLPLVNHKQTTLESIETSYSIYWVWYRIVCQIWAYFESFAWGFNSRFNSAAETLFLVNHKQITSESIENPYIYLVRVISQHIKFGLILILFAWSFNCRFNFTAN